ncbi:MAG: gliding motility-associated C-terminal domain-containing protein [Bacteroidetes bacterium]|nr:gliding motility-associated C-terminal domain-containing protein [Bacteroidota bacterium]
MNQAAHAQTFDWAKSYGGASGDYCYAMTVDNYGNVYNTGTFIGTADMDPGVGVYNLIANNGSDFYISKLDSSGNFIWAKNITGVNSAQGLSVKIDKNDNIIVAGTFTGTTDFDPGPGVYNMTGGGYFILKLDMNGNFIWAKSFVGGTFYLNLPMTLAVDSINNVYCTGSFNNIMDFDPGAPIYNMIGGQNSSAFISKLDSNGNFVWAKQIGIETKGLFMASSADGYIYIATLAVGPGVDYDPGIGVCNLAEGNVIVKLTYAGNFVWAKGTTYSSYTSSIAISPEGDIIQTGRFKFTVDFNPGPAVYNIAASFFNDYDIFVCKWDSSGNFIWAKSAGNLGTDEAHSLDVDSMGNIFVGGIFDNTVDFDFGLGTYLITPISSPDCFFLKMNSGGNMIWAKSSDGGYSFTYDKSIIIKSYGLNSVYLSGFYYTTVDFDPDIGIYNFTPIGSVDNYTVKLHECIVYDTTLVSGCDSLYYDSILYTNSATFYQHFLALNGCDSIHVLSILINHSSVDTISQTICQGDSFLGYFTSGTYIDTLVSYNGCDSIRTLNLIVLPNLSSNISQTICQGDSYQGYSLTGIYIDTLVSYNGCDSIRTINLTVLPNSSSNISQTICQGDTYLGYSLTGTYIDTLVNNNGCDSVRTLYLIVLPSSSSNISQTICQGDSYLGYSLTGVYIDTLVGGNSCDSIRTLNLIVLPNSSSNLLQTICEGESYLGYTTTGSYIDTFISYNGCDSLRIIDLSVIPKIVNTITHEICPGETFLGYKKSGIFIDTFQNFNGCDSIRILRLKSNPNYCCKIFVPNAFSPNGDDVNDEFLIKGVFDLYEIRIADRWGNIVYESSDQISGWGGRYKYQDMPVGVYYYICRYKCGGEDFILKGDIILIR